MSTTEQDLANPLAVIHEGITSALLAEEERYAAAVAALTEEHQIIVDRMKAALAVLDGGAPANGHSQVDMAVLVEPELPIPEVGPGDVEVDLSGMTMEQACLTIMSTRPGQVWRAEDLQRILDASGRDGKLSSIRACLSLAFRNGKLKRADPGEYIHP